MAKQRKDREGATRGAADEDSLLIQSAEALGRVIGSLQRQLHAATKNNHSAPSRKKKTSKNKKK